MYFSTQKLNDTIKAIQNHPFEGFLLSFISNLGFTLAYSMQK